MLKNIFTDERIVMFVVCLGGLSIYLTESGYTWPMLAMIDLCCSVFFVVEMLCKNMQMGVRDYWSEGWNVFDGVLTILCIPSIVFFFLPTEANNLSLVLVLRLLRVLRFFRVIHFFPGFQRMINGFRLAMSQSYPILLSFLIIIVIFGLINCALFRDVAPEFFGTPTTSIYSVFRLCTIEGWYEIPDAIAEATSPTIGSWVSFYFCLLLIMGGIIGMSFINSIFVDAMVSDNNDDLESKVDELNKKIDELTALLNSKDATKPNEN